MDINEEKELGLPWGKMNSGRQNCLQCPKGFSYPFGVSFSVSLVLSPSAINETTQFHKFQLKKEN